MRFQTFGGLEQLSLVEVPPPVPGPRQILVDTVRAPYDVIFDAVMNRPFAAWRPHLAETGIFVSLLPKPDHLWQALTLPLRSRQRLRFATVTPNRADLCYLGDLARQGALHTVIDSVHPLEELAAALRKSQSGRARGKIIVAVKD